MKTGVCMSEFVTLKSFDNLFINLTEKFCNQKCKNCYIDFPLYKKVEDFISVDLVKDELSNLSNDEVECIYLTGAEPMTHPDFNAILRMCLKMRNVCIFTNGSFINEKKARFLKKVEDETSNELIFKISLDHYDELKNDDVRYRGAFRHSVFSIRHLCKYGFNPIISVANYYNESFENLLFGFKKIFVNDNYELSEKNLQVVPFYHKDLQIGEIQSFDTDSDCKYGRVLSSSGIYSCPFLSGDYRGRCGSSLKDYSKKVPIETNFCSLCAKSGGSLFGIDFKKF